MFKVEPIDVFTFLKLVNKERAVHGFLPSYLFKTRAKREGKRFRVKLGRFEIEIKSCCDHTIKVYDNAVFYDTFFLVEKVSNDSLNYGKRAELVVVSRDFLLALDYPGVVFTKDGKEIDIDDYYIIGGNRILVLSKKEPLVAVNHNGFKARYKVLLVDLKEKKIFLPSPLVGKVRLVPNSDLTIEIEKKMLERVVDWYFNLNILNDKNEVVAYVETDVTKDYIFDKDETIFTGSTIHEITYHIFLDKLGAVKLGNLEISFNQDKVVTSDFVLDLSFQDENTRERFDLGEYYLCVSEKDNKLNVYICSDIFERIGWYGALLEAVSLFRDGSILVVHDIDVVEPYVFDGKGILKIKEDGMFSFEPFREIYFEVPRLVVFTHNALLVVNKLSFIEPKKENKEIVFKLEENKEGKTTFFVF